MKKALDPIRFFTIALACAVLLVPAVAFAQGLPPGATPAPASQLQAIAVIVSVLFVLNGEIAQIQKTGKLLWWTFPVAWTPYLPPLLGFLGAFGTALGLGASIQSALLLGLSGIGAGYGVGRAHHAAANATAVGMRRNLASGGGMTPPAGTGLRAGMMVVGGLAVAFGIACAALSSGCTKAQEQQALTVLDTARKDFVSIAPEACALAEAIVPGNATVTYLCDIINGQTGQVIGKASVQMSVPKAQAAGFALPASFSDAGAK